MSILLRDGNGLGRFTTPEHDCQFQFYVFTDFAKLSWWSPAAKGEVWVNGNCVQEEAEFRSLAVHVNSGDLCPDVVADWLEDCKESLVATDQNWQFLDLLRL